MKKIIIAAFLLVAQANFAQTVTKETGDFDEVKVFDRISLQMIQSKENKIEITGARSEDVEVINKNGELKIRMKFSKLLKGEEVTAKLYFKNIDNLEASEGSYVSSEDTLKAVSFEINAREGAEIKVKLDVDKLKSRTTRGGILKLSGKATNQEASITTGGIIEARNLATSQTTIKITTGGEADVSATDLVDANVKAGGTITIYGKPKKINQKTILGGSIVEAGK
ncbi:head GIN domain-containing protein [Flavobacterium kingsejongi]|uniref:Chaperonin n=1 Tax=Flavobacterium kingsejongi TaxID=1678728 RepID=A0A2S1LLF9_9FLAO|nr:head GIN domain-containing protein [Flavobacterium kingsejongi]AWG24549.1 chaperonin [Flavobacterium kingsejongi]